MSLGNTKRCLEYIVVDNAEYPCLILSDDQNQQSDIEYILVDDIEAPLNAEVAEMLGFGWELYGYPFSHNGVLVQCLITKRNNQTTPTE